MAMSIIDFERSRDAPPNTATAAAAFDYNDSSDNEDVDDGVSDAGTSLYSYIPDDTSLNTYNDSKMMMTSSMASFSKVGGSGKNKQQQKKQAGTTMEKSKQKGLLWSVMDTLKKHDSDTDNEGDMYVEDDYSNSADASSKSKTLGASPKV